MAITAAQKYRLNHMNRVAGDVQLGTLIEEAESAAALDLTNGQILIGDVSNVASPHTVSGDITLSNAGVASLASAATDGLKAHRIARATFDATGGKAIAAHGLGVTIPDNAVITRAWYDVITTFTSDATDAGTIAIHAEGADDLVAATAISAGGNVFDAGLHEAIPVGTAATMVKTSAARELTATVAIEPLLTGKLVVFVEYVVSL